MNSRLSNVAAAALVVAGSVAAGGIEAGAVEGIQRYCHASWRQARIAQQDWHDCTQQVYLRLLDRLSHDGWSDALRENTSPERRELNRAIWATTKRWQRARRGQTLNDSDLADNPRTDRLGAEMRRLVTDADILSRRQREILLQTLDGATVAQIAEEMKLPATRISDEKYKAIKKLRALANEGQWDVAAAHV